MIYTHLANGRLVSSSPLILTLKVSSELWMLSHRVPLSVVPSLLWYCWFQNKEILKLELQPGSMLRTKIRKRNSYIQTSWNVIMCRMVTFNSDALSFLFFIEKIFFFIFNVFLWLLLQFCLYVELLSFVPALLLRW